MRLFTAVELPEAVREAARRAYEETVAPQFPSWWATSKTVRAVEPENLHVTVRFLGEVMPDTLPALREALADAAASVPATTAQVRGFGQFPVRSAPRVLWAGIDDPARTISAVERAVTERIAPLGFPPEDRPYTPHVTVARISERPPHRRGERRGARREAPRAPLVLPADLPLGPAFEVQALSLVASELTPRGPKYRTLARFALSPSPPSTSRGVTNP